MALTDTQSALLSAASQRDSGSLLPLPSGLGPGGGTAKAFAALVRNGLAEERPTEDPAAARRSESDGDDPVGIFITLAGAVAIGIGPSQLGPEVVGAVERGGKGGSGNADVAPPRWVSPARQRQCSTSSRATAAPHCLSSSLPPAGCRMRRALPGVSQALDQLGRGDTRTERPRAGLRLMREWAGRVHVVEVGEDEVIRWDGRDWRSLSEVARVPCPARGRHALLSHPRHLAGLPLACRDRGDPVRAAACRSHRPNLTARG